MNYQSLFDRSDKIARAALIGVGEFGRSLVSQSRSIDNLEVSVLCDRNLVAARDACRRAGIPEDAIALCDSPVSARKHLERFIALAPSAPEAATAKRLIETF